MEAKQRGENLSTGSLFSFCNIKNQNERKTHNETANRTHGKVSWMAAHIEAGILDRNDSQVDLHSYGLRIIFFWDRDRRRAQGRKEGRTQVSDQASELYFGAGAHSG